MTLQTCRIKLELAKREGNDKDIKFWEGKITHREALPKYVEIRKAEEEAARKAAKEEEKTKPEVGVKKHAKKREG